MSSNPLGSIAILSTAGAVPVKNEKGEISMRKVKVSRYIAGKRPEFAQAEKSDSGSESDDDEEKKKRLSAVHTSVYNSEIKDEKVDINSTAELESAAARDPRWRRLQQFKDEQNVDRHTRISRHRHIDEPEIVSAGSSQYSDDEKLGQRDHSRRHRSPAESSGEEEDELSDQEYDRRRMILRQRAKDRQKEEELLSRQQEEDEVEEESGEEEESDDDEYSDSGDETLPMLKPVFVRKRDRITLQETEKEQERIKNMQLEQKKMAEERKVQSVRLVENIVRQEQEMEKRIEEDNLNLNSVCTDDENEELAYEAWKIRELKRVKRDKEEREILAKEKAEWEKVHNMTEEERRTYSRANPRVVTNKQTKSKYKFLQKYYHRGVFFLDEENAVFKQDFAEPTLEDHFDKTILPKVMQVKDFGKAGRTKWTHLANEDTTDFQSAWVTDSAQNIKFFNKHGGGIKDIFERPPAKKKKKI